MDEKERAILELQKKVDCILKVTDRVSPMEERLNNLERERQDVLFRKEGT